MIKISCLGPAGTFSERAAKIFANEFEATEIACYADISGAMSAVDSGLTDFAVIPLENQIEGVVNASLDNLIFESNLFINKKLSLKIEQNLLALSKYAFTSIMSHPHALAQCSSFLRTNFPNIALISAASTAEAAEIASKDPKIAAIGDKTAAQNYGLKIIHQNIADNDRNYTSFALLSKKNTILPERGVMSCLAFSSQNKPGGLYKILSIFSILDINLTAIHSRPIKDKKDEYVFFIEFVCENTEDTNLALKMIELKTSFAKPLGNYKIINC